MKRQSVLALVASLDLKKMHHFINPVVLWEEFEDGSLRELTADSPHWFNFILSIMLVGM